MIPVRICLAGFMSYRDRTELFFDGAPIWMLTGSNGAGKSAIFDAITFALYGAHRGGKQEYNELINKQADRMLVEFDFRLGDDCYQIKRTLSRKGKQTQGKQTFEIFYLSGPNSPNPQRPGPHAVPETNSRQGLDRWVEKHTGLDYKAFVMSALLQQGKSDKLLEADPAERHRLLSQLVDLSVYERLVQRAEAHLKEADSDLRLYDRRLAELQPVDPADIEALEQSIMLVDIEGAKHRKRVEQIIESKVHALRWPKLVKERDSIESWFVEAQQLLDWQEQIYRDAERLDELQSVIEPLERILRDKRYCDTCQQQADEQDITAQRKQQAVVEAEQEKARLEATIAHQRKLHEQLRQKVDAALQQLLVLTPHLSRLEELSRKRKDFADLTQQLKSFPADLDLQVRQLQEEMDDLIQIREALPYLEQYVRSREEWVDATRQAEIHRNHLDSLRKRLVELSRSFEEASGRVSEIQQRVARLQKSATEAQTLRDHAQRQLDRFGEVASQPTCSYCGQKLTANHIEMERGRLEREFENASHHVLETVENFKLALSQQREAETLTLLCHLAFSHA